MSIIYDSVLHKFREQESTPRLSGGMMNKGSVPTVSALNNLSNVQNGDWYRVEDTGFEYYFDGTTWHIVGTEGTTSSQVAIIASDIASSVASTTINSSVNNGSLTILQDEWELVSEGGTSHWELVTSQVDFSANTADDATVVIPPYNSATVTISQAGSALGSFTTLDPEDVTILLPSPGAEVKYGGSTISSIVQGSNVSMALSSGALTIAGKVQPLRYNGSDVTSIASGTSIHMAYNGGVLTISGPSAPPIPSYSGSEVASYVPGKNVTMGVLNGGLTINAGITYSEHVYAEISAGDNVVISSAGSVMIISTTGGGGSDVIYSGSAVTSITEGDNVSMSISDGTLAISATAGGAGITYSGSAVTSIVEGDNVSMSLESGTLSISAAGGGTVGSGILTISQGGMSKGEFSANATTNSSINLDAPTNVIASGATITSITNGSNIHLGVNGGTMTIAASGLVTSAAASTIASDVAASMLPQVGSATLTIYQGGVSKGEFNANATTNSSIYLDAGGGGGGGGTGVTPLTSITTLTGTSVTIEPGGAYTWSVTEDATLNISGGEVNKTGDSLINIDLGNASITAGAGLDFANALTSNTLHQCAVRWNGTSATLYTLDNVDAQYLSSYVSSYVSAYDSTTVQPISASLAGKMNNPVSSGASGQFLMRNASSQEWKSLSTLTIVQGGVSSSFNPANADATIVVSGGGGGGGVTAAQAKKIAMIFG